MIPHLIGGLLWEVIPFLGLGPLGIGIMLLRRFSGVSVKMLLILAAVGVVLIFGWSYNRQRNHIAFLESEYGRLIVAVQTQEDTIDLQRQAIVSWRDRFTAIQDVLSTQEDIARSARAEMERLRAQFSKEDLTGLAGSRPEDAAAILNARTDAAIRRVRCSSGAADDCDD